jgi:hypothetical protein
MSKTENGHVTHFKSSKLGAKTQGKTRAFHQRTQKEQKAGAGAAKGETEEGLSAQKAAARQARHTE